MTARPKNQAWTLMQVLREASGYLESHGVDQARLNAERLLSRVLGIPRIDLYLQFEKPLETGEREKYKIMLRRRAAREPLQYILGETEFMSLPFRVTPDVLIPRPETEILVEKTIDRANQAAEKQLSILDIGTGSGCIAVSLARALPQARITATDQSGSALQIAKENAVLNGVSGQIAFHQRDIMHAAGLGEPESFDLIVSNPPYIKTDMLESLDPEIKDHEPAAALDGGPDGLNFYRVFAERLPAMVHSPAAVFLEIGSDQGPDVQSVFGNGPWTDMRIFKDLAGLDRVVMLEYDR